jgi:hypothetical protein
MVRVGDYRKKKARRDPRTEIIWQMTHLCGSRIYELKISCPFRTAGNKNFPQE